VTARKDVQTMTHPPQDLALEYPQRPTDLTERELEDWLEEQDRLVEDAAEEVDLW